MKKLIILPIFALTGCATIISGGPDTINLMTSDGSRVQAQVNSKAGTQQLTLPTLISVPKSCSDVTVQVMESNKVQSSYAIASSTVNPWIFGNIILGGIIGLGIDAAAGNICTYNNSVVVPITSK